MTGKIFAFGDSFLDDIKPGNWLQLLSESYNIEVVNFAKSASGPNWSLKNFWECFSNGTIKGNDTVIFCLSFVERLYTIDMPDPSLSMITTSYEKMIDYYSVKQNKKWITENLAHLRWAAIHLFAPEINFESLKIIGLFNALAMSRPDIKFLVLRSFDDRYSPYLVNFKSTENFYNLTQTPLIKISQNELGIDEETSFNEFLYVIERDDAGRANHFSWANCSHMAEMIYNVIQKRSVDEFDWNRFQKQILRAYYW